MSNRNVTGAKSRHYTARIFAFTWPNIGNLMALMLIFLFFYRDSGNNSAIFSQICRIAYNLPPGCRIRLKDTADATGDRLLVRHLPDYQTGSFTYSGMLNACGETITPLLSAYTN